MNVVSKTVHSDIATVYIAKMRNQRMIEFVESIQHPYPIQDKWILMISTLFGCPVKCLMCDAGGDYLGKLTKNEMLEQIEYLIGQRFLDGRVKAEKFKIQFARMGEPAFNKNVINLLRELPAKINYSGTLIPSISTIAPAGTEGFFKDLLRVKREIYNQANFQFQFSLHSTNQIERDKMIPVKKWDFEKISKYGDAFYDDGDRKITLNFALHSTDALDPQVIKKYFNRERFLIKITPVNPTVNVKRNKIQNIIISQEQAAQLKPIQELREMGYDLIISIGELEENRIGSNCGQYIKNYIRSKQKMEASYTYSLNKV